MSKGNIDSLSNYNYPLYLFLNYVVGPLSVYICALNRTFLLVDYLAYLVRT